ncbi:MAG: Histidine kinase-like ATPase protein [Bacteroidetes bacterium]|jgi:anti-sigma regulatory factor (Ser/Thr protein kinase)|nr:Histidine kinase-like ATPase protein [Bacteroidota bacterium]
MKEPVVNTTVVDSATDTAVSLTITLPRIPDIELVALEGLERLARHLGIGEEKIGEARIVVTEAIINALEHAGGAHPSVRVEFTISSGTLVVFVRDRGKGFNPATLEDPVIQKKLGTQSKRGWGMKLMKSLSDDFRIQTGKSGTTITITKRMR